MLARHVRPEDAVGDKAAPLHSNRVVSTANGIMSHFVNLEIVVPEAFIVGAADYHVVLGGTINLVCVIEKVSYN
ncbi:unnamed protein product [Nezara viridula]|uniref:Uncharacterized protein n=1 Tax=Nezara viridula TaxID=85310 RepID=A0A9P0H8K5_NEZVI|nr:unnamed protein product [Nezara viridula]